MVKINTVSKSHNPSVLIYTFSLEYYISTLLNNLMNVQESYNTVTACASRVTGIQGKDPKVDN